MKYVITLLILSSFLACNPNCVCKMQQANVDVVQGMYDAFAEGNVEAVLGAMAENVEWNEAENFPYADNNPYVGPNSVAEGVFTRIGEEWEYWKLENMTVLPAGSSNVIAQGRYKAKNKATGKELDAQFAHFWTIADGKVAKFQQYADTYQSMDAVMVEEVEEESEG